MKYLDRATDEAGYPAMGFEVFYQQGISCFVGDCQSHWCVRLSRAFVPINKHRAMLSPCGKCVRSYTGCQGAVKAGNVNAKHRQGISGQRRLMRLGS